MTTDRRQATDRLQQTFREWVRKGMPEPAPAFDDLRDSSMYLPADVIAMLVDARGLSAFWTYGQAVRQLAGEPTMPTATGLTA